MKKYEFTGETKNMFGRTLHRIKALIDFTVGGLEIKAGDLGGWIEKEENLSHEGNAWVFGDACAYGNAVVCGDAKVSDGAVIHGNTLVCGDADIKGVINSLLRPC